MLRPVLSPLRGLLEAPTHGLRHGLLSFTPSGFLEKPGFAACRYVGRDGILRATQRVPRAIAARADYQSARRLPPGEPAPHRPRYFTDDRNRSSVPPSLRRAKKTRREPCGSRRR